MKVIKNSRFWELIEENGSTKIQHKTLNSIFTEPKTGQIAKTEREIVADMDDQEFIIYCNLQTKDCDIPLPF